MAVVDCMAFAKCIGLMRDLIEAIVWLIHSFELKTPIISIKIMRKGIIKEIETK